MRFYDFMVNLGFPRSYIGKILLVNFLGIHVPVLGLTAYAVMMGPYPLSETWPFLAVTVVATGVGTVVTLYANYALLAPIRSVSMAMRQYLADKSVAVLPLNRKDEAGHLMSDVMEGITRLDHAIDAEKAAREDTEDRHRDAFSTLSEMSHELRTPLNHIIGFSELMQSDTLAPLSNSNVPNYPSIIEQSGGDMLEVVESILALSEIEAERVCFEPENVDMDVIGRNVFGLAHHHAQERDIELVYRTDTEIHEVQADTRALKQVLQQSIMVALETTPNGRTVEVILSEGADGVVFEVRCEGAPFGRDDIPVALRETCNSLSGISGDEHQLSSVSRAGLSLVVIHALVQRQGGTLVLSNISGDGGKSIRVRLPVAKSQPEVGLTGKACAA